MLLRQKNVAKPLYIEKHFKYFMLNVTHVSAILLNIALSKRTTICQKILNKIILFQKLLSMVSFG
jgi:hypothetical protein